MFEGQERLWKLVLEDDAQFYEEYLVNLTDEEFNRFLEENPDFLKE